MAADGTQTNYVPSGAGGRLAALEREHAAQAAQKDEQLAQKAAQLAEQATQLAQQDAIIAAQAARIAALEATAAAAPPRPPTASARQRAMIQDKSARQAQKFAHERAFNNSLEPQLRTWMSEAPTMVDAALLADKAKVLALEKTFDTPSAQAGLVALLPAITARLRATAQPYVIEAQAQRLLAIVEAGNQLYFGIYHGVLDMVRSNDGYDDFCAALDAVEPDRSRFPQPSADLATIYAAAREALPLFGEVLLEVARRAGGAVETRAAPLKHVFRVLQKHAIRVDGGKPTEFETACDIVRGSTVCASMGDLLVVLRLLLKMEAEGLIKIVRFKNRFKNPTAAGWADAMLNYVCLGGGAAAASHVCELQLVHATMLKARKEFGGHAA
jgi:hypothetical protein